DRSDLVQREIETEKDPRKGEGGDQHAARHWRLVTLRWWYAPRRRGVTARATRRVTGRCLGQRAVHERLEAVPAHRVRDHATADDERRRRTHAAALGFPLVGRDLVQVLPRIEALVPLPHVQLERFGQTAEDRLGAP